MWEGPPNGLEIDGDAPDLCICGARDRGASGGVTGCCAEVLVGPTGGFAEGGGGVDGPVGVAEEFAGEKDEVGLAGGDDGVGLGGVSDQSDGGGGDVGLAADSFSELNLEAGGDGDFGVGDLAAGGAVDEIDAVVAEVMGELDGLVDGPAWRGLVGPVGGGDADEEGEVGGPLGADGVNDFKEEADAVFKAAAVVVGSVVGEGGEEFVEQVAVGGVDFNEVKTGGEGSTGG